MSKISEEQFTEIFYSHVKIETSPRSISNLFLNERKRKKIDYKPYYQRNYVWDDHKATYFIESILLGTEIPPLIFFNEGNRIEVIDGRQRFETIKRFLNGDFSLTPVGLTALPDLSGKSIENFRISIPHIYELFIDAKIRIIEFKLVNNPPSDVFIIDRIKKEIFSRYNSGITPLKKAEIDNAIYDSDALSNYFKERLKASNKDIGVISRLFLRQYKGSDNLNIESIMAFVRKSMVMYKFPIKHYARGSYRGDLIKKFYEFTYENIENDLILETYDNYMNKIILVEEIKNKASSSQHKDSRLFWECLFWAVNVLEQESVDFENIIREINAEDFSSLFNEKEELFDVTNSHYHREVLDRYTAFAEFIERYVSVKMSIYVFGTSDSSERLKEVLSYNSDTKTELEKLSALRITKPDPARSCIEDILSDMKRSRFLVRPSYQRSEVKNLGKSSAIIESILLGIMLPAIFIYKHNNGIIEVIDGQQRLLTILAFMGKEYIDENNNYAFSKNNNFSLKGLKVLSHLNGSKFDDLSEDLQEKIWDFELFIVEIGEQLNPEFNPVDLFIRLNDKPYPIKENSFEMWNSWVDKEVVEKIKYVLNEHKSWFFIKNPANKKFRDRMENEELITILSYYDYKLRLGKGVDNFIAIYKVNDRINSRVKDKKNVTATLFEVTEENVSKDRFLFSIENVNKFLNKLSVLLDHFTNDLNKEETLNALLSFGGKRKYSQRRTLQDLYILWYALESISLEKLQSVNFKDDVRDIFYKMKNITEFEANDREGASFFISELESFKKKYS